MGQKTQGKPKAEATRPPAVMAFDDRETLAFALMREIGHIAKASLAARNRFTLALSGGSLLDLMAFGLERQPFDQDTDWPGWHLFWVDERWVAWSDPESNYGSARGPIFSRLKVPAQQICTLDASKSPTENAAAWISAMQTVFQVGPDTVPPFDLILLGIGADGHTASLFPGHPVCEEMHQWVAAVFDAPKPPPTRVTMTLPVINNARNVIFVAAGAGKAPILSRVINPRAGAPKLPAQRVAPTAGRLRWLVDRAAASGLSPTWDA